MEPNRQRAAGSALALVAPIATYVIYWAKGQWDAVFWEAAQDFAYVGVQQSILWLVTAGLAVVAGFLGMSSKQAHLAERKVQAAAFGFFSIMAAVVPVLSLAQAVTA